MKRNFLLVDDDKVFNFLNEKILQKAQVASSVSSASNGLEALDFLQRSLEGAAVLPDIILLDLNMPVMNGFEFLNEYQKRYPQLKGKVSVVVLTSSLSQSDQSKAKALGIDYYLTKPLTEDAIVSVIGR